MATFAAAGGWILTYVADSSYGLLTVPAFALGVAFGVAGLMVGLNVTTAAQAAVAGVFGMVMGTGLFFLGSAITCQSGGFCPFN